MKPISTERKSRVLTKAQFGCLRGVYTLNVSRGCEFRCVYCYARGYPDAPPAGEVHVYRNLPAKLADELDNPRRRSVIEWVVFNTASDSFQTHPDILDVAYRAMAVLLEREVGFSFLTKGWIPDRFIKLFSAHPGLVTPEIGLVSTNPRYRDVFEPHAATALERLENIDRLKCADLDVRVRIDPIIPFYTDDEGSIRDLYEALRLRDIRVVALNYVHMRPAILRRLRRELPPIEFDILGSCFRGQPWTSVGTSARSKRIPVPLRRKGYQRFLRLAGEFGIRPFVCACKNPDVPARLCPAGIERREAAQPRQHKGAQLPLFPQPGCGTS